ncbi:ornithine cyclodeaminase family protein [Ferruginivarius sediminum]|uniref:Ornithine cyclodeaminase family protein n=1 Tax=Ferruginivarius sediminum TaxID=2661937 RepID=A0A369T6L9_9PROT|nr:ornithine cyclodeaminase family protein [Ferruginivarius sediminum]RDD60971.1 ornithine cyclodeaminase family protein [Ferruginivarius sediminum]
MRILSPEEVGAALDYPRLVEALRDAFREGLEAPTRHHHTVPSNAGPDGTLLLMPAWQVDTYIGVKVATVFPANPERGLPSVLANYLLNDGKTGEPLALVAGQPMTNRRTAAASALAADYLARKDASRLLMVGTGAMVPELVDAHASVRPIEEVRIWGRTPEKAQAMAAQLQDRGFRAAPVESLEEGVAWAQVISCATMSAEPLVLGEWLQPGQHVDLVGAFKPTMRETDDACVRTAELFCDTFDGALSEGGDIVQPLNAGVITREDIKADFSMLTRGQHPGRERAEQITLFKSTGAAVEDLAAAILAYETAVEG